MTSPGSSDTGPPPGVGWTCPHGDDLDVEDCPEAVTWQRGDLRLRPVTREDARKFIGRHHRHNLPPRIIRLAVGVEAGGELVGVATASNPVARGLDDGRTLEVQRSCTDGTPNANSMLYGAISRAAKALGFHRLFTYTLATEPGTSLKAAGWVRDAELPERGSHRTWDAPSRPRVQTDLFGEDRMPTGAKVRWVKQLAPPHVGEGS